MNRAAKHGAPVWAAAVAVVALAGCGASGSASPAAPPAASSPAAGGPAAVVTLRNVAFRPSHVVVVVGATVEWRWADGDVPHNVDFGDGTSGDPTTRGKYRRSFGQRGSFAYRCDVHPGMRGTVSVT